MRDYWPTCGFRLLTTGTDGQLRVTDEFLRSLLERPELAPVPESCAAELALHQDLLDQPRRAVDEARLALLADEDARANYAVWLRFRTRLLARPTLEASYLQLFRGNVDVPPLFVHQLTQVLLRHILGGAATPFEARAAEMLFRPQRIALQEGQVMAADDETVERQALSASFGSLGDLIRRSGASLRTAELDVLTADSADGYWPRNEAHDFVVALNHGQPALAALCRVLERWVAHFLGVQVTIAPEGEIDDDQWVWHVGLDAQATAVLNALYQGEEVADAQRERMLCLFRLDFTEPGVVRPEVAGRPVYLAMAMDEQQRLRLKPQNLLLNLPLARQA
ncbi:DUF6352 family protein [Ramlibacter tataouinensis]|uniref:Uncharacterized protein n=1 Tax=Ramlibacter tataouinensis (strain ATCC BAA-407 / DSM 14655 / LMG 21543 / TTB310) TaxID=365046 RepID=F5Y424_RAMTT|nr:DUF6352 family protein [Ramlibacter tataouinensis]AEG91302.1 Hypothetical protein Rta_02380 [Ramlibacter tataouinensis TTB310]